MELKKMHLPCRDELNQGRLSLWLEMCSLCQELGKESGHFMDLKILSHFFLVFEKLMDCFSEDVTKVTLNYY